MESSHTEKPTVLIIDDDTFLLDMYSLKFSESDFAVETTTSCADALAKLAAGYRPDVLLVDVVMPGMDGIQFLTEIKQRGITDLKHVVVLSNLGQKEDIDRGLSCGAHDYIVKANFTPSEVVHRVKEIMTR